MRPSTWLVALALLLAACGSDDATADGGPTAADATGTLWIGLEELDGVFVEGFELAFDVTAADGTTVRYRWDELVTGDELEWPPDVAPDDIRRWYAGVLVIELPAGETTITSKLDMGMEPPGEPCSARVEVPADGQAQARILLTGDDRGCPVGVAPAG